MKYFIANLLLKAGQFLIRISNEVTPIPTKDYIENHCRITELESTDELRTILNNMGLHNVPIVEIGAVKESPPKKLSKEEMEKMFLH